MSFLRKIFSCLFGNREVKEEDPLSSLESSEETLSVKQNDVDANAFSSSAPLDQSLRKPISSSERSFQEDLNYWAESTLKPLETLLLKADYSTDDKNAIVSFYRSYMLPSFGPRPDSSGSPRWRSFMTDDFTPIEFSWNWGLVSQNDPPTIRFSIEPISYQAGSPLDPWNSNATTDLVSRLEDDLEGFDGSLFRRLAPKLIQECGKVTKTGPKDVKMASPTSMFLAFDLEKGKPSGKAYFVPFGHFVTPVRTRGVVIKEFLSPLAEEERWSSLSKLLDFGENSICSLQIEPIMVAFDCVPMEKNRIKVYFRSADTSFDVVKKVLTAFDSELITKSALADLEDLWKAVFGQDPRTHGAEQLPFKNHETSGILYYFEVRPGSDGIVPKVYLPAKHYGINDLYTAEAVANFFRQRGNVRWANEYTSAIKSIATHRDLEAGTGFHTYITCAFKKGALDVTSYFNPELFRADRQQRV